MSSTSSGVGKADAATPRRLSPPRGGQSRFGRLAAAAAAVAVVLTGATTPAAQAVTYEVGDFISEGVLSTGKFLDGRRVAVSPVNGDVYVTDAIQDSVFRFSDKGTLLGTRGGAGSGDGKFANPSGIAVDSDGFVYVADTLNHRIQKFTSGLTYVNKWGEQGNGADQLNKPSGVAISAKGNVIVTESANHRVHVFGPNGGNLGYWGQYGNLPGQYSAPGGVSPAPLGNVLIADTYNSRLMLTANNGNVLAQWGNSGPEPGQYKNPMDLAVEKSGKFYVADYGNKRIQQLDGQGNALQTILLPASAEGVAYDESLGRLYTVIGSDLRAYRKATAPSIGSCPTATGTVGAAYASKVSTGGFPDATLSKWTGTFPTGLTLKADGTLSGTPTVAGSFDFELKANNNVVVAPAVTKKCTVTIKQAPAITSGPQLAAVFGKVYNSAVKASGYPAPTFKIGGGALPNGLTLAPNGTISGTPTKNGNFAVTITATNAVNPDASKQYNFSVTQPPSITNGPTLTGTVGEVYNSVLKASGYPAPSFSKTLGVLPPGLTLAPDGTLSGTPTQAGSFNATIQAANGTDPVSTKAYTFTIAPKVEIAPVITSGPKLTGTVDTPYESQLTATGIPEPKFIDAGTLPPGLSLVGNTISGTPTQAGSFDVTIVADNGVIPKASKSYKIVIAPKPEAPEIKVDPNLSGTVGEFYSSVVKASGFPAPTFTVAEGALPTGLTLATNGTLSGIPSQAGSFKVKIQADNGVAPNATKEYTITIQGKPLAPVITVGPKTEGVVGVGYVSILQATGYPDVSEIELAAGQLPPGLQLNGNILSGIPTQAGSFAVALRADNGVAPASVKDYTIKIAAEGVAPTITAGPKLEGVVGNGYVSVLKASGFPSTSNFSIVGGDLPPGLTLKGTTISGTPSQAGTFAVAIEADNGIEPKAVKEYEIKIAAVGVAPAITVGPKLEGLVGDGYVSVLKATGFPSVSEFSVSAGALPPGLELVGDTISGTPTKAGSYAIAIRAENGVNPAAVKDYTITIGTNAVAPSLTVGPKTQGVVGLAYSSVLKATGFPSVSSYEVTGELPPGLMLVGDTILGTPTQAGTYPVTIQASNGVAPAASKAYSIEIAAVGVAPQITGGPKADGAVGIGYLSVLQSTGFPAASFDVYAGALPPGLKLEGDTISGTPSTVGSYAFALRATNGVAPAAIEEYTIKVAAAGVAPQFTVGPKVLGTAGKWYSAKLSASGSPAAAYSIASGALPTGLKLAGGAIYGTPTRPGTYKFTLRADNKVGPAVVKAYYITIAKASSKVTAKFSTKYPRVARTNIRATIKLSAPYTTGLSKTGKVRVYYGKKRVKTYSVSVSKKGVIKVKLPKFKKKGKTKVTLRYLGNSQLKPAKRTIYVRVR